jgi:hypothetical protein
MAFGVKQTSEYRSWTQILVEESEYSLVMRHAKRQRTFRRMYMTVFTLFLASFVFYCSLFYVGAYVDVGKIVGISYSDRAAMAQKRSASLKPISKRTFLSPFFDQFAMNRVYMRSGQSILATYALPDKSEATLFIRQCKGLPIIEIFGCQFTGEQTTLIQDRQNGFIRFTVSEEGFYYFDARAVKVPKSLLKQHVDYKVIWRRS